MQGSRQIRQPGKHLADVCRNKAELFIKADCGGIVDVNSEFKPFQTKPVVGNVDQFGHECRADPLADMIVMYAHDECCAMTSPSSVPEQTSVSDDLVIDCRDDNCRFRSKRLQPLACRLKTLKRNT